MMCKLLGSAAGIALLLGAAPGRAQQAGTGFSSPPLAIAKPWVAYTPTLSAGSGTFTSATASMAYTIKGSTLYYSLRVNITTNGSAANNISVTLPISSASGTTATAMGREVSATGNAFQAYVNGGASSLTINSMSNGYIGGNGYVLDVTGFYQIVNPAGGP